MARAEFHKLTVSKVRCLTDESVAVSFAVPDSLQEKFAFIPGQYLTLKAVIDGENVRRSYSICSKLGDAPEVGIKKLAGGKFSNYAQTLQAGCEVEVMTPQGSFTALPGGRHRYLLVAAGSGITPCLAIAKTILAQERDTQITLIYGNRSTSTVMFRQDIGDLKDRYTDRFMVINILSRETQESDWLNGRISGEKVERLAALQLISPSDCDTAYICGPAEMVESVSAVLNEKMEVKTELFTTGVIPLQAVPARALEKKGDATPVSVTIDGAVHQVLVNADNETVLTAAQRAGLDLPFSCAGGMCCTCRCKVLSGQTAMDMNFSLADWEVEAGFTLACQTRPLDDKVVLDFDEF